MLHLKDLEVFSQCAPASLTASIRWTYKKKVMFVLKNLNCASRNHRCTSVFGPSPHHGASCHDGMYATAPHTYLPSQSFTESLARHMSHRLMHPHGDACRLDSYQNCTHVALSPVLSTTPSPLPTQVPLVILSEEVRQYVSHAQGNTFFWVCFCVVGQPLSILAYYHDWALLNKDTLAAVTSHIGTNTTRSVS